MAFSHSKSSRLWKPRRLASPDSMSIDAITVSRSFAATNSRSRWPRCAAMALKARASGTNSAGNRARETRADQSPWPNFLVIAAIISIGWMMSFSAAISAPISTKTQTKANCR